MSPDPYYTSSSLDDTAHHLRYTWTGWPSGERLPPRPDAAVFDDLGDALDRDDIHLLETDWTRSRVQMTASARPHTDPTRLAGRMKGRLQYALRNAGEPVNFSRKLAVRSVGENRRAQVEHYVAQQVDRADYADPAFEDLLEDFTVEVSGVDLAEPAATESGRYWYNLHLVLTVRDRYSLHRRASFAELRDMCFRIAEAKGWRLSVVSVMPDHVHVALGADPATSPEDVALAFMNNLAYAMGMASLWQNSFYVGTFGEYDMAAVRFAC